MFTTFKSSTTSTSTQCLALSDLRIRYRGVFSGMLLFSSIQLRFTDGSSCIGRSHGGSRNSKKLDSGNVFARWTPSLRCWIRPWRSRVSLQRLRSGGRRRCRLSRRCCRRTNTPSLIARRRNTGKPSTVSSLSEHLLELANDIAELPKWTRVSQRLNPPGY